MCDGIKVVEMMRANKVTIRELAARLQMAQTRVRYRRRVGFTDWNTYSDWVLAITGSRPNNGSTVPPATWA